MFARFPMSRGPCAELRTYASSGWPTIVQCRLRRRPKPPGNIRPTLPTYAGGVRELTCMAEASGQARRSISVYLRVGKIADVMTYRNSSRRPCPVRDTAGKIPATSTAAAGEAVLASWSEIRCEAYVEWQAMRDGACARDSCGFGTLSNTATCSIAPFGRGVPNVDPDGIAALRRACYRRRSVLADIVASEWSARTSLLLAPLRQSFIRWIWKTS